MFKFRYRQVEMKRLTEDISFKYCFSKAGLAVLIPDKVDLRVNWQRQIGTLRNDKRINLPGRHNNVYVPHHRASKYMKQKPIEFKGEIDKPIVMAGDFNAFFQ